MTTALVGIAGDFNDTPTGKPLEKLTAVPNLTDVLKNVAPNLTYHTGSEQID